MGPLRVDDERLTVQNLLKKLARVGVVTEVKTSVDRRHRFYGIDQAYPIALLFQRYGMRVSWRLLHHVGFKGVWESALMGQDDFMKACRTYCLSPQEGIEALKRNKRKIAVEYRKNRK